jgi:hypothetical protein
MKTPRLTIYDIKRIHEERTGGLFFSRPTMKFFRQKMKDFSVRKIDADYYFISAPSRWTESVYSTERYFNIETGELTLTDPRKKEEV